MKTFLIVIICLSLFLNSPAEAKAVLDNPANADPAPEIAAALQKTVEKNSKEMVTENKALKDKENKGYDQQEIELLARLVHAEAKGEPYKGKIAVAAAVLNRVESPEYPDTIREVIYQNYFGFQYCTVRNGQINLQADENAYKAAKEALRGNDPTNGALSFYNPAKTSNRWICGRSYCIKIGNHIFVQ